MKKINTKTKWVLLCSFIPLTTFFTQAQTVIYAENFETDGEGTRYTSNTFNACFSEPADNPDYFFRTNTNPVIPGGTCTTGFGNALTNLQGSYFWASEDIRGSSPVPNAYPPGDITTQSFSTLSLTNLKVALYLATASNNNVRWETSDSINIQVSLNGGPFFTVGRFMGDNPVGGRLRIDGNLDGLITGLDPATTCDQSNFTKYTFDIPGTASTMRIKLDFDQAGGTEELAIDQLEVTGTCPASGTIRYVDASAPSGGTGTSWTCAFQNLQDAINAAASGNEIWVKAGTYKPTKDPFGSASPADPRDKTFYLKSGVKIFGGFAGTETLRSQRDWLANVTTLSGDIDPAGNNDCYHVVLTVSDVSTTELDGFTITGGKAVAPSFSTITVETKSIARDAGGGMSNVSAATAIRNCVFTNNSTSGIGGGVYHSGASSVFTSCSFSQNTSTFDGGGVYAIGSTLQFMSCTFSQNTGTYGGGASEYQTTSQYNNCTFSNNNGTKGGGISCYESPSSFTTCTFFGNAASNEGGGIYLGFCNPTLTKCIIKGNSTTGFASDGGGISNLSASPNLTNCMVTGNLSDFGGGCYTTSNSFPSFTNCTICGNNGLLNGGAFYTSGGHPILRNSIVWDNKRASDVGTYDASLGNDLLSPAVVTYSLVQGSGAYNNNIDGANTKDAPNYPGFVSPIDPNTAPTMAGDLHFQTCSPAINTGTAIGAPTVDFDGNPRPFGSGVDMGVYEFQGTPIPTVTYYRDNDGDGFGSTAFGLPVQSCVPVPAFAPNNLDCNDANSAINPNSVWYLDTDNDGYYAGTGITQCTSPGAGYKVTGLLGGNDCNNNNAAINPGATEVCNGIDDNCNGMTDENGVTWYADADHDGFGNPNSTIQACTQPTGYVANSNDCNDNDPGVHSPQLYYIDSDADGFGSTTSTMLCSSSPPAGYASNNTDCNDSDASVHSPQVYYVDTDSDGFGSTTSAMLCSSTAPAGYATNNTDCNDNDASVHTPQLYYVDSDGDGFGSTTTAMLCSATAPTGYATNNTDCNDNDASIHEPQSYYVDGDSDGFGSTTTAMLCSSTAPTGYATNNTDCNDSDAAVHEPQLYYVDSDGDGFGSTITAMLCSSTAPTGYAVNNTDCNDNDVTVHVPQLYYVDGDGDGFGSTTTAMLCSSTAPTGYAVNSTDCNDNDASVYEPQLYYVDADGDGFGSTTTAMLCSSTAPTGYTTNNTDCNDTDVSVHVPQVYYVDGDGDGFGSTTTAMLCSSTAPTGFADNNTDCNDDDASVHESQLYYVDADGDGFGSTTTATLCSNTPPTGYSNDNTDCDDDPITGGMINPTATEICNGIDDNCNNMTDEGLGSLDTWYADTDNDGFGDPNVTFEACSQPTGYVTDNTDCNDNDSAINPAAAEVCDGIDNDCDNMLDNGTLTTYYRDMDSDGFGDPAVSQQACSQPSGYVTNNTDCDDNDSLEHPGQTWYSDADNDGYSNGTTLTQCLRPTGYKVASELTATSGDCNDGNAAINPAATEVCDGIDNNCNAMTDEGVQTTYYRDMDSDGFGNPAITQQACSQPSGYVGDNTDCDDNDSLEHPGQTWYADADNDGYSNGTTQTQCLRPNGYKVASELTATSGDCNDNNAAINPAATEVCDGIDNNCNSMTDEGVQTTYYRDMDSDGFGNPAVSQQACSQPSGYVVNNTDCDDNDPLEKPGQVWYADADNDGYSNGTTITQCLRPNGYKVASELTATSGDCNDGNAAINPAATEVCDGIDNNCNSMTDEGVQTTYYRDMDNDGFGNAAVSQQACSQPNGYVINNTDCDDNDPLEKPGQVWYADVDNDGYSNGTTLTQCLRPNGYKVASELTSTSGDCNDGNAAINPAATEVCDGIDNNCNAMTDEGVQTTYYRDMDNDGFGNAAVSQQACSQPIGYVVNNTDCDDNDPLEKPGQVWYADVDNDGYSNGTTQTQCLRPNGYKVASELTATSGDCNDGNAAINPAATEVCDGIDNNCNSMTDEGGQTTYYRDMDSDGFGDPAVSQQACSQPSGYVVNNTDCDDNDPLEKPGQVWYADADNDGYSNGTTQTQCLRPNGYKVAAELTATSGDCNDGNAAINPAAAETCDGIDNNCNSMTDEGVLTTYYRDMDSDGFGDPSVSQQACSQPSGYVVNNTDCDDNDPLEKPGQVWYADADNDGYSNGTTQTQCLRPNGYKVASELTATSGDCNDGNAAINPAATEVCDGIDNNCNAMTDEGVQTTYYRDMDNDGFGNAAVSQQACSQPIGYVVNNTDCDDNDPLEKPGQVWYADADNDGYSNGTTQTQCLRPNGYKVAAELTATSGDCNDGNAAINPAATEVCDGIDNNCNSMTDEGVQTTYYRDMDSDGFGDPAVSQQACSQPSGYVVNNTDCDDNDPLEKPGQVWYADADNDGYSNGTTQTQCLRPNGYKVAAELTATSGDCNDSNAAINPGATEICDGIDNNCNSMTDEGVLTTYYRDMDSDGFGNPAITQQACSQPSGYVVNNTDCDDNDPSEKPGQVWYKDADNDGYSDGATLTQCLRPNGYKVASELTATSGDCNDGNAAINPAATEVCDGIDNNCNAMTDEGVQTTYYRDMDNDGFGNAAVSQQACSQPSGYVGDNTDCDDNDPLEKPGQVWYADTDNDGYSNGTTITQCLRPNGYKVASELTATSGDCNDGNAAINPAATEICDGIDNNCNSMTDEGVQTTYYRDMDNDGFGDPAVSQQACSQPSGYVVNNTDCDDNDPLEKPGQVWYADTDNDGYSNGATETQCLRPNGYKVASELTATSGDCNDGNAAINPAAAETCDGIDNNCNSMTDEGVLTTYYRDMDSDGFGNPAITQQACSQPSGYVVNNTDCDDNDPLEKPGQVWYADADNDGYSNGTTQTQCLRPNGYKVASELTATSGDCNDNNASIHSPQQYYVDGDGDTYGSTTTAMLCSTTAPTGYSTNNMDCNDGNAAVHPNTQEVCDGVDNDCDYLVDGDDPDFSDTTPPVPVCNTTTVYVQTQGFYTLQPGDVLNFGASYDNCGTVLISSITPEIVTCDQIGQTVPVLVTIADESNNKADCMAQIAVQQGTGLPGGWTGADVGSNANGSSQYTPCATGGNQTFTLNAQGYTTNTTDVQHTVYQNLCGDVEIIAHIGSIAPNGGWAGIQMREDGSQGAKKFTLKTQLNTILRREIRTATFGPTNTLQTSIPATHTWLRLVRSGSIFSAYSSPDGINWTFRSSATITMNNCIWAGLFVESINNTTTTTATFDHVMLNGGAPLPLASAPAGADPHEAIEMPHVKIFPNPTNGELNIDLGNMPTMVESVVCTVYNNQGQQILKRNIAVHGQTETIDLSPFVNGVYWVRIQGDNIAPGIRKVVKADENRP